MSIVTPSLTYFGDPTKGRPLFNADIYVGEPDTDPQITANQKQVSLRLEDGTTVAVGQPVSTGSGGYVTYNGSYAVLVVDGDYSVKVLNNADAQALYIPSNSGIFDASQISLTINSLARDSVQSYLSNIAPQPDYAAVRALDSSDLADGDYIYVQGFSDPWQVKTGTVTDSGWYIVFNDDSNRYCEYTGGKSGIVSAEVFGFLVGQGSSFDAAVAFNAASQFVRDNRDKYSTVTAKPGVAHIQTPIKILQSVNYALPRGNNVGVDGLEFVATPQLAAMTPPTDIYTDAAHLPGLALLKTPMLYNTQLLTRQDGGMFNLNADGQDVYGAYINERYFGSFDFTVTECPNAPITLIYNQFNNDNYHESRECSGPVRYVMCNSTKIGGLDIELCDSAVSALDIVHSISTKNNVRILNFHYEEKSTNYPTTNLIRIGGRGIKMDYGHFTLLPVGTAGTRYIDFLASGASYAIDNATVTTTPCLKVDFTDQMFTDTSAAVRLGSDANSCNVDTTLPLSSLVNNSTLNNHVLSDTLQTQIGRGNEFANSDGTRLLGSAQDNRVNFFDNANRYVEANGANVRYVSAGGYQETYADGHRFFTGDGSQLSWENPLYMFSFFIWVDASGAWRRNATSPTSDTDGTTM